MKTRYYLLIVRGDIEPEIKGPFPTELMRDSWARTYRQARDPEAEDGLYPLNVDAKGSPFISTYSGAFLQRGER